MRDDGDKQTILQRGNIFKSPPGERKKSDVSSIGFRRKGPGVLFAALGIILHQSNLEEECLL